MPQAPVSRHRSGKSLGNLAIPQLSSMRAAAAVRVQSNWGTHTPLPSRRPDERRGAAPTAASASSGEAAPASLELEGLKERTRGSLVHQVSQLLAVDPVLLFSRNVPVDVGFKDRGAHARGDEGLREACGDAKVPHTYPIPALCRLGCSRTTLSSPLTGGEEERRRRWRR